jgi:hypothetical protein
MTFVVDFPAGSGFSRNRDCPGLRYAMHRELFSLLADKAVAAGFAVCRFNWRFYESDPLAGQPSSALQDELEQLKEVIGQLRQNHAYCQRKCMSSENHSVASLLAGTARRR